MARCICRMAYAHAGNMALRPALYSLSGALHGDHELEGPKADLQAPSELHFESEAWQSSENRPFWCVSGAPSLRELPARGLRWLETRFE